MIKRTSPPITDQLNQRIMVMDGAIGTAIQAHGLTGTGNRFSDHSMDLKGNNEILTLTQPDIIRDIHASYLNAGADIIETNTFTANAISQADYGTESLVFELNFEAARLAQAAVQEAMNTDASRTCYVAGALGPTTDQLAFRPTSMTQALETFHSTI